MKKNKGFTLTEIITTLIILGVILLIAVPSYGILTKKFKKDYYRKMDDTLLENGKNYFLDHKNDIPIELLNSDYVDLNGENSLVSKKYTEKILKYNSNEVCNGYVVVIKNEKDYIYKSCLDCGEDYRTINNNDKDNYCSSSWKDNNNIIYEYGEKEKIPLYVDFKFDSSKKEDQDKLKDLLKINKVITKRNEKGEILKQIISNDTYYPENYQQIDLKQTGNYSLKYSVPDINQLKTTNVLVFLHEAPKLNINSYDLTIKDTNNIELTSDNKYFNVETEVKFNHYEQKINNGVWEKINCNTTGINNKCIVNYLDYDQLKVKYRLLDDKNNVSKETKEYNLKIDKFYPEIQVTAKFNNSSGITYDQKWTNNNVYIEVNVSNINDNMETQYSTDNNYWINFDAPINQNKQKSTLLLSNDMNRTYYFRVIDKNNSNNIKNANQISVKIDKTIPNCSLRVNSGTKSNDWYTSNIEIGFNSKSDGMSGIDLYGIGTSTVYNSVSTYTINNNGTYTIYGYVKDIAGNSGTCNITVNIDKDSPELILVASNGSMNEYYYSEYNQMNWTKSGMYFNAFIDPGTSGIKSIEYKDNGYISSFDNTTQCNDYRYATCAYHSNYLRYMDYVSSEETHNITVKVAKNNGKTKNATYTIKIDRTANVPTIILNSNTETSNNVTFTISANDSNSGVKEIQYSYDKNSWYTYTSSETLLSTTGVKNIYARIVDNAGNTSNIVSATGKCDKDGVDVSPNTLAGGHFTLSFSLKNSDSSITSNKYQYAYWNAVSTTDTTNQKSSQVTTFCGTMPPATAIKTTTNAKTANLYMKYQKQYYCFAVRPYRSIEISELNRWTVQYKHAKTTSTVNSSNYNGY